MKKVKIMGFVAGILSLAIGAGGTYAWFTSESTPTVLEVNTARIQLAQTDMKTDISKKLPGESFGFNNWEFRNNSTRESVVEFSINAYDITYKDGSAFPAERKNELLKLLNDADNIEVTGVRSGLHVATRDARTGYYYIYLNSGDQLDGDFSITMKVPTELGGNYLGDNEDRSENQPLEHEAIIYLNCRAYAVQATEDALIDIFDETVAGFFF